MNNEFENQNRQAEQGNTSELVGGQPSENTSSYYHYSGDPNPRPAEESQSYQTGYQPGQTGYQGTGYQSGYQSGYQTQSGQSYQSGYQTQSGESGQGYQPGYQTQSGQNAYQSGQTSSYDYGTTGGNVPPTSPMSGYNVNPEPPRKKKKGGISGKGIAAIALACVLVGGAIGGGVGLLASSGKNETTAESTLEAGGGEETAEATGTTGTTETAEDSTSESTVFNTTTIDITTNSTETEMTPQDVYENYVNAVVLIYNEYTTTSYFGSTTSQASGSGMIISTDGYILTNNHVVENADTLTVQLTSGEEYTATLIGADEENDVALIKIEGTEDFPTVSIGDSNSIQVGEQVCAIGNPLGELTNTLTVGYISALDREIAEESSDSSTVNYISMFQTDCAINSGNSGGPLFDMNGNVIGITTAKYSSSSSTSSASIEGLGFCIPINDAMSIVNDLLQYGYVKGRVSMGITCQTMDSTVVQTYNLPSGVLVMGITEGSAAEEAGLQKSDIICAIDDETIESVADLKIKLKSYAVGDSATLSIYRTETGEELTLTITFTETDETTTTTTTEDSQSQEQEQQEQQQQQQEQQQSPYNFFGGQ